MKIVITGSLGNISKPLTIELVQKGHSVTVITSKPGKQHEIEILGATAAIGTLEDPDFLTSTFEGADSVYTMIPPNYHTDKNLDLIEYCGKIAGNYSEAIRQSGVNRVVHLSSIGAHLNKGTGLILSHHAVETILSKLTLVDITYMRPTAFYYNLLSFIPSIKNTGLIASNYGAEDIIPWVSPVDIAAAIAEEIVSPTVERKVRYVASEELSCNQIASILGEVIGMADLKWVVIPDEKMKAALIAAGTPAQIALQLVEMNASIHNGLLMEDYNRNKPSVMGKTKMKDFAEEFAVAFKQ